MTDKNNVEYQYNKAGLIESIMRDELDVQHMFSKLTPDSTKYSPVLMLATIESLMNSEGDLEKILTTVMDSNEFKILSLVGRRVADKLALDVSGDVTGYVEFVIKYISPVVIDTLQEHINK